MFRNVLVHIERVIDGEEGMAGGNKRIMIDDDEVDRNRISELPVNIREHILDCMSITEAVATSVLSSKWRYCWTGLRKLMFNKDFWDFDEDILVLNALEHARAIDRVLMLHSGPIREFILYIPEILHMTLDINMWLRVLSNHGVQNIEIKVDGYEDTSFPIPSCLFHCRELEKLSLRVCMLTLPTDFKGFANLTSLSLYHVDIAPSLLESLISGCLLLETLSLEKMRLHESLALEALNLKTFYFDDLWLDIIFKDHPKLTRVLLLATDQSDKIDIPQPYNTLERLGSLSMIKELTYDLLLLEPLLENCPNIAPTPLENLESLAIQSLDLSDSQDVLFTLCLIRSAPNLQNLTLHLDPEFRRGFESEEVLGDAAKLLESEAKKYESDNNLQTIKIGGTAVLRRHEILLIGLLQTCCPKLKSIVIKT